MPGTAEPAASPSLDLNAIRACHQQAGRILIEDLSERDIQLLQTYHRHVGGLLALLEGAAERADAEMRGAA